MPASVAIVGAGAAGAVTAARLRELVGPECRITVLESSNRVGGRAHRVRLGRTDIEVGASILHTRGRRLGELAERLGIPRRPAVARSSTGIWDGTGFLLRADVGKFDSELLKRYGSDAVKALAGIAIDSAKRWENLYALQDDGVELEGPSHMLDAVGAGSEAFHTLEQHLSDQGVSGGVVTEFVTGALRNIYNQGVEVNAFAGCVALAGIGLVGGSLYAIQGGNDRLFRSMIDAADVDLMLNRRVRSVHEVPGGFAIDVVDGEPVMADAVVLACPRSPTEVTVAGTDRGPQVEFKTVHVTLVSGDAAPAFYSTGNVPEIVLTTSGEDAFTYCGVVDHTADGRRIWKVFSPAPFGEAEVNRVFGCVAEIWRGQWQAYPDLRPRHDLPDFESLPGLFDVSTMESAASTMEHQATAAWSVAGLVARYLRT